MNIKLTLKQKITYTCHLLKALSRTRFKALIPLLSQHIKRDSVVVDIGANAGYYTKIFSRLASDGQVISFEPSSYALSILRRVTSWCGLDNVQVIPCGLGSKSSGEILFSPIKSSGSIGFGLAHLGNDKAIDPRNTIKEEIFIETLDKVVAKLDLKNIDFIKIDIEGMELRALNGASSCISAFKPILMIEVNEKYLARVGDSVSMLWKFLNDHGYTIYKLGESGETALANDPIQEGDILCIPEKS